MPKINILLAILALFIIGCNALAQEQPIESYVYMVSCKHPDYRDKIRLTGFRLKGTKGIVTALHGVIGATSITARNNSNDVLLNLRVDQVDIENDIALLTSDELLKRDNNEGLIPIRSTSLTVGEKLRVIGHPLGISTNNKTVYAGNPISKRLSTLIPPTSADSIDKRKSPFEGITVLYIEQSLVPGHSGAPILTMQDRVVGIVDGGLLGGAAGINWGIPIDNIQWSDATRSQRRLNELSNLKTTDLFALEPYKEAATPPPTTSIKTSDFISLNQLKWKRDPVLGEGFGFEKVNCSKGYRVTSLDNCILIVEESEETDFIPKPSIPYFPSPPPEKLTYKTRVSIPLDKIDISTLTIFENSDIKTGPVQKWGIVFETIDEEKNIDFVQSHTKIVDGEIVEREEGATASFEVYYIITGDRNSAVQYLTLITEAIRQCRQ